MGRGAKKRAGSAVELRKNLATAQTRSYEEMKRIIKIITICKNIHAEPKPRLCTVQLHIYNGCTWILSNLLWFASCASSIFSRSSPLCVCGALCSFASSALTFLNTLVHWTYVFLHSSSRFFAVCTCVYMRCAPRVQFVLFIKKLDARLLLLCSFVLFVMQHFLPMPRLDR